MQILHFHSNSPQILLHLAIFNGDSSNRALCRCYNQQPNFSLQKNQNDTPLLSYTLILHGIVYNR